MSMHSMRLRPALAAAALAALLSPAPSLSAQADSARVAGSPFASADTAVPRRGEGLVTRAEVWEARMRALGIDSPDPAPRRPTSRADSMSWERARAAASRHAGRRVVVSLFDRRLWVVEGRDTLLSAPVGIGMGKVRVHGEEWDHSTPRGRRVVRAKETDPLWVPPDWHYLQSARRHGRSVVHLLPGRPVTLADGRRLVVRDSTLALVHPDGTRETVGTEHNLVFDGKQVIPPVGTVNRRIPEVLGAYKLDLGDGYLIHGTNDGLSIGFPSTHGCIRVDKEELEQLYAMVPTGTPVFIY